MQLCSTKLRIKTFGFLSVLKELIWLQHKHNLTCVILIKKNLFWHDSRNSFDRFCFYILSAINGKFKHYNNTNLSLFLLIHFKIYLSFKSLTSVGSISRPWFKSNITFLSSFFFTFKCSPDLFLGSYSYRQQKNSQFPSFLAPIIVVCHKCIFPLWMSPCYLPQPFLCSPSFFFLFQLSISYFLPKRFS